MMRNSAWANAFRYIDERFQDMTTAAQGYKGGFSKSTHLPFCKCVRFPLGMPSFAQHGDSATLHFAELCAKLLKRSVTEYD